MRSDGIPKYEAEPADLISGVVFTNGHDVLCGIDWIDQPDPGQIMQLLQATANALARARK